MSLSNELPMDSRLKLSRKAGGSIIDHKPVFSANSRILYIGCGPVLKLFSTDTGEHVRDIEFSAFTLDKPEGNIIDIILHPLDKNIIYVCFEDGRLIAWSFEANCVVYNRVLGGTGERNKTVRMKLRVRAEENEKFDVLLASLIDTEVKVSVFNYTTGAFKYRLKKRFDFLMHSWSVSERGGKDFLAGICKNRLFVHDLKSRIDKRSIQTGGGRYFTCVVCHPTEESVAVGDNTGRVIVYQNILSQNYQWAHFVYHWHTLPVNDVVFSPSGGTFYTGGNEHVLIKWSVDVPDAKHFIPRLPGPIVHLTVSSDNQFVALSSLDNSILIVDTQQKIRCTLQQFTWGFICVPGQQMFPSGLVLDPRSECIVMNGKQGHIQFYSPRYSSIIYNVNVVGQNYITQERDKQIQNIEVVGTNFSCDGLWLATVEFRNDTEFNPDSLLKFWAFERERQTYRLKSCVTLQSPVSKLLFQPLSNVDIANKNWVDYMVATQCADKKFRLWINEYDKERPVQSANWRCYSVGYYKEHSLNDICFSSDGSLLGAAFGPCFTVWDTDTNSVKCVLTKGSQPLRQVIFSNEDCSFIAVSVTESTLFAWNLLSLTLLWSFDLSTSFLVADPCSEYLGAFTTDQSLYVFKASSSEVIYKQSKLCDADQKILAAVFFPTRSADIQSSSANAHWLQKSSLYFFTSTQELKAFEYQGKEMKNENTAFITEKAAVTPFQALVASQTASAAEKSEEAKLHLQLGESWSRTISQFIHSAPHAMAPVHLYCESLLKSLIISRPLGNIKMKAEELPSEDQA